MNLCQLYNHVLSHIRSYSLCDALVCRSVCNGERCSQQQQFHSHRLQWNWSRKDPSRLFCPTQVTFTNECAIYYYVFKLTVTQTMVIQKDDDRVNIIASFPAQAFRAYVGIRTWGWGCEYYYLWLLFLYLTAVGPYRISRSNCSAVRVPSMDSQFSLKTE